MKHCEGMMVNNPSEGIMVLGNLLIEAKVHWWKQHETATVGGATASPGNPVGGNCVMIMNPNIYESIARSTILEL